jgi:hypothetical protein
MVYEVKNCAYRVVEVFRERQGVSDQPRHPLAERAIESFNVVGFAAFLSNGAVPFLWKSGRIRLPKISISDGAFPVLGRQRQPQFPGGLLASVSNVDADNFPRVRVHGKPNPLLFSLFADKRPQLVAFDGQAAGFFLQRPPLVEPTCISR